jgi:hypothetical protein
MFISAIIGMMTSDEIITPNVGISAVVLLVLAYLQFVLVHTIVTLILLYHMWSALEDGVTPITGGKAVGFLFIPVFGIYWLFRAWGSYTGEYNKYLERHRLGAPQLNNSIFMLFIVTMVLTMLLLVPILVLPLVTVFVIARGCDAINNLEIATSAAAAGKVLLPSDFIGTPENPRSKVPVLALGGAFAVAGLMIVGLATFSWFNLHPNVSADLLPSTVGNFTLQQQGDVNGSFFGRTIRTTDNFYVSDTSGGRQAITYNVIQYWSEEQASKRIESTCGSKQATPIVNDQSQKETARMCIESGMVWMQNGRYFAWAHEPSHYDLEKLKAKEASLDSIVDFVKALPLNKKSV